MPLALSWLDNVWQGVFLEHCCSTNNRLPLFCFDQKHNNLPVSMFYLTQVSLGGIVCCDLFLLKYSMFTCAKQFFQSNLFISNPHKGLDRVFLHFSCNLPTCPCRLWARGFLCLPFFGPGRAGRGVGAPISCAVPSSLSISSPSLVLRGGPLPVYEGLRSGLYETDSVRHTDTFTRVKGGRKGCHCEL